MTAKIFVFIVPLVFIPHAVHVEIGTSTPNRVFLSGMRILLHNRDSQLYLLEKRELSVCFALPCKVVATGEYFFEITCGFINHFENFNLTAVIVFYEGINHFILLSGGKGKNFSRKICIIKKSRIFAADCELYLT